MADVRPFHDRTPGSKSMSRRLTLVLHCEVRACDLATIASFCRLADEFAMAFGRPGRAHRAGLRPDRCPPLAFGVLIVFLVITGSIWIIVNLNANMMPMPH